MTWQPHGCRGRFAGNVATVEEVWGGGGVEGSWEWGRDGDVASVMYHTYVTDRETPDPYPANPYPQD